MQKTKLYERRFCCVFPYFKYHYHIASLIVTMSRKMDSMESILFEASVSHQCFPKLTPHFQVHRGWLHAFIVKNL